MNAIKGTLKPKQSFRKRKKSYSNKKMFQNGNSQKKSLD
jgi:hypothetical protein